MEVSRFSNRAIINRVQPLLGAGGVGKTRLALEVARAAQRMCGALGKFWEARAHFQEAHRWIDAAITMRQETKPAVRAKLLMAASRLALWEIKCERSRELAQEALALYEAVEDVVGRTWAIYQIDDTWYMQGEYALATRYLEESLHLLREQKSWGGYALWETWWAEGKALSQEELSALALAASEATSTSLSTLDWKRSVKRRRLMSCIWVRWGIGMAISSFTSKILDMSSNPKYHWYSPIKR